jgi:hypothetical protein
MSLIVVQPKEVLSFPDLERAVVRFIYDEENMPLVAIQQMQKSLNWWWEEVQRMADRRIHLFKSAAESLNADIKELNYRLAFISLHIRDRDVPHTWTYVHVRNRKRHKIDYKKANFMKVKFKGSHSAADYERATRLLEKWNEKNPELA